MSVALWAGKSVYNIGSASFLKAFFSTIFARLEGEVWGSRYPTLMRDLYSGHLPHRAARAAEKELRHVREGLGALGPDQLVWDFEDRSARPPWSEINPQISSLAEYFVTSDGKELLDVMAAALHEAARRRQDIEIR